MKTIRRVGRIQPMIAVEWYQANKAQWKKLKNGEEIEVPNDVFEGLKGVKEVEVEVNFKKSKKSKPVDFLESKFEDEEIDIPADIEEDLD